MLPPREGLYHARIKDIGLDETGPNNLSTCIIRFAITEELNAEGEWLPCESDGYEITGYFYLEKKDGSLNVITIDALKAALGWDGRDALWLQDADLTQKLVQIRVGVEQYQGRDRMRVQFLNPYGAKGGGGPVPKADENTRRSIANRLGAKLRALSGPGAPPPPPTRPPTEPATKAATLAEAWEAFLRSMPAGAPESEIHRQWFGAMAKLFGDKQPDQFTAADWARMRDEAPHLIVPF